jgi:hypothetical protein
MIDSIGRIRAALDLTGCAVGEVLMMPAFSGAMGLESLRRLAVLAFARETARKGWEFLGDDERVRRLVILLRALLWARGVRGVGFPGGAARATCRSFEPSPCIVGDELHPLAEMRGAGGAAGAIDTLWGVWCGAALHQDGERAAQRDDLDALAAGGMAWQERVDDALAHLCGAFAPAVAAVAALEVADLLPDRSRCCMEAAMIPGHDRPEEHRRGARLPAVVAFTRRTRRGEDGEPRGMIPGGEDEGAYLAAIDRGETDPDPVWSTDPPFIGGSWGAAFDP